MKLDYTHIERLLEEGLSNAERAGIDRNSLSCFRTQVGSEYESGGLYFLGRATNGWNENAPKSLSELIELNNSQLIRVIRDICRYVYGPNGEDYVAYSNVCRIADCDAGNPSATVYKATKEQNDMLYEIDMEELRPAVVIAMVGDSVGEDGWQSSIWDGFLNKYPGQYQEVKKETICVRDEVVYTATLWQLKRDGESTWLIFAERPETIELGTYVRALVNLLNETKCKQE